MAKGQALPEKTFKYVAVGAIVILDCGDGGVTFEDCDMQGSRVGHSYGAEVILLECIDGLYYM